MQAAQTSIMSMMHGNEKSLSNTGCPWPGGPDVTFTQDDVVQLGKLHCWGSACVQFFVRLREGREVFVRANKLTKDNERFLRRSAKPIQDLNCRVSREEGFRPVWGDELPALR